MKITEIRKQGNAKKRPKKSYWRNLTRLLASTRLSNRSMPNWNALKSIAFARAAGCRSCRSP